MTRDRERTDVALADIFDGLLRNIHTCIPGQVISFDADNQTCSVRPCLKRVYAGVDDAVEISPIEDVPVVFPGSDDLWLTFDLKENSYVLLVFSERSIALWQEQGGTVDPAVDRTFDYSDAIAIPGILPDPVKLSASVESDTIAMRNSDNTVRIAVKENGNVEIDAASVTINGGADSAALTSKVDSFISTLDTVLRTAWIVAPTDGGAALKTAYLSAFVAPPLSVKSFKLKVDQ